MLVCKYFFLLALFTTSKGILHSFGGQELSNNYGSTCAKMLSGHNCLVTNSVRVYIPVLQILYPSNLASKLTWFAKIYVNGTRQASMVGGLAITKKGPRDVQHAQFS